MSFKKIHNFKVSITIHQVKLSIRFPCSVSIDLIPGCNLKNDHDNHSKAKEQRILNKQYKLEQGCATVNQTLSTFIQNKYNPKLSLYSNQIIILNITLRAASGQIPAGYALITVKPNGIQSRIFGEIEKCPDINAKLQYTVKTQFIGEEDYLANESILLTSNVVQQYSIVNTLRQDQTPIDILDDDERSQNSCLNSQNIFAMEQFKVQSQINKKDQGQTEKQGVIKLIEVLEPNYSANYCRQSVSSFQKINSSQFSSKRNSKILLLESQNVNNKKNIKQQQFQILLRQSSFRIDEPEFEQNSFAKISEKQQLNTGQKINKKLESEFRLLKQKYDEHLLIHISYIKSCQIKENNLKQEVKSMKQKLVAFQDQKQLLIIEKNQLVNLLQREDIKQILRKMEQIHFSQNIKLKNKIIALEKIIVSIKEEKDELEQNILEIKVDHHRYKLQIQGQIAIVDDLKDQINDLILRLQSEREYNKQLRSKLEEQEQFEEELRQLKKKMNKKQHILRNQNKTIMNLQENKKILARKSNGLESLLKEKSDLIVDLQNSSSLVNNKQQMRATYSKNRSPKTNAMYQAQISYSTTNIIQEDISQASGQNQEWLEQSTSSLILGINSRI